MIQKESQLTVQAAAKRVGCTPRTLYRWMARGELTFIQQTNGRRLINVKDLFEVTKRFQKRHSVKPDGAEWSIIIGTLHDMQRLLQDQTRLLHGLIELYRPETLEALNRKRGILSERTNKRN